MACYIAMTSLSWIPSMIAWQSWATLFGQCCDAKPILHCQYDHDIAMLMQVL